MYEVTFLNEGSELSSVPFNSVLFVEDLERALALASMLGKISTLKVGFNDIHVQPSNINKNEKKKK